MTGWPKPDISVIGEARRLTRDPTALSSSMKAALKGLLNFIDERECKPKEHAAPLDVNTIGHKGVSSAIADLLRPLSDDERMSVLHALPFCKHCGTESTNCQCWNDE